MAAPMPKEDLDDVFGAEEAMPAEDMPLDDEMAGDEEALNMAIDEAFEATDPEVRREAFKNAVRLCGGHY